MYVYSAHGNHRSHWRGRSPVKQRRYMAITRLAASVWPSDCGWKADVMCSLVPSRRISSFQNVEVNTGSRSDTMDWGTPWRRTMSVKNACATDSAEYGWASGMKWQYLLKRSTTVRMTDLPRTRGSASTKSMPMSAQTAVGAEGEGLLGVGAPICTFGMWHMRAQNLGRRGACRGSESLGGGDVRCAAPLRDRPHGSPPTALAGVGMLAARTTSLHTSVSHR